MTTLAKKRPLAMTISAVALALSTQHVAGTSGGDGVFDVSRSRWRNRCVPYSTAFIHARAVGSSSALRATLMPRRKRVTSCFSGRCPYRLDGRRRNQSTSRATSTVVCGAVAGSTACSNAESVRSSVERKGCKCQILSEDPEVFLVPNLLSPEECQEYIDRATALTTESEGGSGGRTMTKSNPPEVSLDVSKLWPLPFLSLGAGLPPVIRLFESPVASTLGLEEVMNAFLPPVLFAALLSAALALGVTQVMRRISDASSRTSEAVALNDDDDVELIRDLVMRAGSVANDHPWHAFEAPVVTRYREGAVFARHNDASPTRGSEWTDLGGQRVCTVITYLNDCPQGGGTRFDRLGITVQPVRGSALVFFPADCETLLADDRTRHESLPAVEDKWIVQLFGRVGRVPPPLGIPDSFGVTA